MVSRMQRRAPKTYLVVDMSPDLTIATIASDGAGGKHRTTVTHGTGTT